MWAVDDQSVHRVVQIVEKASIDVVSTPALFHSSNLLPTYDKVLLVDRQYTYGISLTRQCAVAECCRRIIDVLKGN